MRRKRVAKRRPLESLLLSRKEWCVDTELSWERAKCIDSEYVSHVALSGVVIFVRCEE